MHVCRAHRCASLALAAALGLPAAASDAAGCRAASGPRTTPLVELYTSEGCDSCPPADRWLSATFPRGGATGRPLALAFHVDYWDRLGWTDRFASPAWTERQQTAMRHNGASFVYTPQVLLQGREFTAWRRGNPGAAIDAIAARPARAVIEIGAAIEGDGVRASATASIADGASRGAVLSIVYVDSGLVSDVKARENRRARLTHDHVVRALVASAPAGGDGAVEVSAGFGRLAEPGTSAVLVAFVQNARDGDVLQAVALPLADCGR